MKKSRYLTIAMIVAFLLTIPLVWITDTRVVKAATTPSFEKTKIELVGEEAKYTVVIKDKIDKSTYSWSSSNTSVAKVSTKGVITAVNKGTAKITCKVTYPSGKTKKTKTLTCNVTVTIPATGIKINNASLTKGAHVLTVGDSFDFNCEVKPSNTSDKVFWSIAGGDPDCLRIDDAQNGKVTALKAGKAILAATAAKTAAKQDADASIIKDIIIIEVVEPVAPVEPETPPTTITSVRVEDSNRILVDFSSPISADSVVSSAGELLSGIEISMSKDSKKGVADDPGKLKASLSSDGKQLTISTEKALNGSYVISFSSQILATNGKPLEQYFTKLTYTDVIPPSVLYTTVDDTGLIAAIYFTEPIDSSKMVISEVGVVSTSAEATNTSTLSILKNAMNYMASEDKKALTIDLTNIAYTDRNKTFKVVISGITDLAGNAPMKTYVEAYVKTDTSYKGQAKVLSVTRTGYNTITAKFDRAIDPNFPGYIQLDGGASILGKVDSKDNKKVNYTISDADANYTGNRKVSIGFWSSYNVNPTDTTANKTYDYNVYFILDKTSPLLLTCDYNADTQILTLNYNEDVTITASSGTISSTFTSANEDIKIINIGYTELAHNDGKNIIKLKVTNISLSGNYNINIPQGFVSDSFRNLSTAATKSIVITGTSGTPSGSELPPPYFISQNTDDLNKITIRFMNKLDTASAQTVANYRINGVTIVSAQLTENTAETGATVALTLADNTIEYNLNYKLIISGVKGFNNSYSAISNYEYPIALKENKRPTYVPQPVFDRTTLSSIRVNFSEPITGTMNVKAYQTVNGSSYELYVTSVVVNDSYVTINLASPPYNNGLLNINVISYDIKDMNGNALNYMPSTLPIYIAY